MRRWGLEVVTFIVALGVGFLVLWSTGVRPDELFEFDDESEEAPLAPLPGVRASVDTTAAPSTVPAVVVAVPTSVPVDPASMMLCVQHTKTFAFMGDQEALDLWRYVGESDLQLSRACQQIIREDSRAVDVWRWELAALPTAATSPSPAPTVAVPP